MIALIVIFSVVLLMLFLPITIKIAFSEQLDFNIKILGIAVFDLKDRKVKPKSKSVDKKPNDDGNKATDILNTVKTYFNSVLEILKLLYEYLRNKLKINEFKFNITFGLSDAALTGIFSGAVYTLVNTFYAYILNTFNVKEHDMKIQPDFENEHFEIEFLLKFNISLLWLLCLLFHERNAIDKLLKIIKKDGVNNG